MRGLGGGAARKSPTLVGTASPPCGDGPAPPGTFSALSPGGACDRASLSRARCLPAHPARAGLPTWPRMPRLPSLQCASHATPASLMTAVAQEGAETSNPARGLL